MCGPLALLLLLGQTPPAPAGMTLEEALAYARAHQPSLQAARARAEAALAGAQVPRAQWFPSLGATVQAFGATNNNTTATYVGAPVDLPRIGGTPAAPFGAWQPSPSSLVAVGLRQEVFDFGRIAVQAAVFDSAAQAEGEHARAQALNLDLAVREAFFAVRAAKSVLASAEAAYQRVKTNREMAAAGVHSGLRAPIELTRADADLMRLDVGRIRAQGSVDVARSVFAAVVGVAAPQLDAQGDATAEPPAPSLAEALRAALAHEPALLEARARLESQQAQSRAILSELLPNLWLTSTLSGRAGGAGSPGTTPQGGGWLPDIPNWDLGLVLSWQWFDATVFARKSASLKLEEAAKGTVDAVRLETESRVQQAYVAVDVASRAVPALQRAVEAARANYAQADQRFRAGLGTSVELADAEAVRVDAEIQLALGEFEYARARSRLTRLIAEES